MSGGRPAGHLADHPVLAYVLAALPPICITLLVILYAVDVPYWDTWDWLDRHYAEGGDGAAATLARYWPLFNDHRVFIPLLIDRALLAVSSIDMLPRIHAKLALSMGTLWLTLALLRRTAPDAPRALVTACAACLTWPLTYWPMWMDPRQFSLHVVVLAMVGAVTIATGPWAERTRMVWSGVLCVVASLSYGPGALTWPFIGMLLWLRSSRRRAIATAAWIGAALVVVGPQALEMRGGTHAAGTSAPSLMAALDGASAVAGLPVAPALRALGYAPTRVMGGVGVIALVWLTVAARRRPGDAGDRALPWMALGAWACTYAAVTGWSRGGLPMGALHDPRFAYLAAQLWMGVFGIGAVLASRPDREAARHARARLALGGLAVLIAAGYASASLRPFLAPGGIGRLSAQLESGRTCLIEYATAEDACLEILYPSAARVRDISARLARRDAAFLRQPSSDASSADDPECGPVHQQQQPGQRGDIKGGNGQQRDARDEGGIRGNP
jgi:hypothetical protein